MDEAWGCGGSVDEASGCGGSVDEASGCGGSVDDVDEAWGCGGSVDEASVVWRLCGPVSDEVTLTTPWWLVNMRYGACWFRSWQRTSMDTTSRGDRNRPCRCLDRHKPI